MIIVSLNNRTICLEYSRQKFIKQYVSIFHQSSCPQLIEQYLHYCQNFCIIYRTICLQYSSNNLSAIFIEQSICNIHRTICLQYSSNTLSAIFIEQSACNIHRTICLQYSSNNISAFIRYFCNIHSAIFLQSNSIHRTIFPTEFH